MAELNTTPQEVFLKVQEALLDVFGDERPVERSTLIKAFDADEFDLMELAQHLEEELDIDINDDDLTDYVEEEEPTVGDLSDWLHTKLQAKR